MNRRDAARALLAWPLGAAAARLPLPAMAQEAGWTPLFNGRDLANWDTFLGRPHRTVDLPALPRDDRGEYTRAVGLNTDPLGVFSVVTIDGRAAIRVSGRIYGGLITREAYSNYHLRFDFKWGEQRWPPRETAIRDTGCCYHSIGPHDASYGFWMKSFEFQVQEGDCGDFYSLAGVVVDVRGTRVKPDDPKGDLQYSKHAPEIAGNTRRIIKDADHERPRGEWNTLELYCLGGTSVHVVNGRPNMILTGLRRRDNGREEPLTRGRIQFQSEGAEVFFRGIDLRPIARIPPQILG